MGDVHLSISARQVQGAYEFLAEDLERFCTDPVFIAACEACAAYRKGRSARTGQPRHAIQAECLPDEDFEYFDPDELGIDPEEDVERWRS